MPNCLKSNSHVHVHVPCPCDNSFHRTIATEVVLLTQMFSGEALYNKLRQSCGIYLTNQFTQTTVFITGIDIAARKVFGVWWDVSDLV